MSADKIVLTADSTSALGQHSAVATKRQPVFWLALACAAAAHGALLVAISRSQPRHLGDPGGSLHAINVELIDAAELRNLTGQSSANTAPAAPAAAPQPAEAAAEHPPPDTAPSSEAASRPSIVAPAPDAETPQATSSPARAAKQSAAKPAAKPVLKPPAQLDLSVPLKLTLEGASRSGSSSSATRPAGITRSGENDRFGRDVIRALKKTMPPPSGVKGRVTIRLFLNERGNIAKVRLVQSGGDSALDQSVVFSVHQASFPFPPKGATVADRTFLVTYIYR